MLAGAGELAVGELVDQRPERNVRGATVTAAAANAVNASPRRLCSEGGPDLTAGSGAPPDALLTQPAPVVILAERTDPAAHSGARAPKPHGDLSVPDPADAGLPVAVPITAVVSARHASTASSPSTGVPPPELHRARRGRSVSVVTPGSATPRVSACPHPAHRATASRAGQLACGQVCLGPLQDTRSRSSRCRFGTTHERGLSRAGATEARSAAEVRAVRPDAGSELAEALSHPSVVLSGLDAVAAREIDQLLLATDVVDGCGGHVPRTQDWSALNADPGRLRRIDHAVQVDLL